MRVRSEIEASIYPIQKHTCVGNFSNNGLVFSGVIDKYGNNNTEAYVEEITFYDADCDKNSVTFYGDEIAIFGQDETDAKIVIAYSKSEYKFTNSFARELFTNRLHKNDGEKTNLKVIIVVRI